MNFDQYYDKNPFNDRNLEQLMPLLAESENMEATARKQLLGRAMLLFEESPEEQRDKAIRLMLEPLFTQFGILEDIEKILDNIIEIDLKRNGEKSLLSDKFHDVYNLFKQLMADLEVSLEKKPKTFQELASYPNDLLTQINNIKEICKRPDMLKALKGS